jgi:hypothetical protein
MSILSGLNLKYQVIAQQINVHNEILRTISQEICVPLPNGIVGDGAYTVVNGAVDQVIPLMTSNQVMDQQFIDYLLILSDQAISFKTQGVGSTPNPVRAGGMALLDSANITSILISNGSGVNASVLVLQARSQVIGT